MASQKSPIKPAHPTAETRRKAELLKQASDPTRLSILTLLSGGEMHVGALCVELDQSQPAVSHHLSLLRHGRLIEPRRDGKFNRYALTEAGASLVKAAGVVVVG